MDYIYVFRKDNFNIMSSYNDVMFSIMLAINSGLVGNVYVSLHSNCYKIILPFVLCIVFIGICMYFNNKYKVFCEDSYFTLMAQEKALSTQKIKDAVNKRYGYIRIIFTILLSLSFLAMATGIFFLGIEKSNQLPHSAVVTEN